MKTVRLVLLLLLLTTLCAEFAACGDEIETSPRVSYGIDVLSAQNGMTVSAPIGNDVVFSKDAIARGVNLSDVRYIKIASLPSVTDGELLLGSSRVAVGETISSGNLSHLSFSAASDEVRHASFRFTVNGGADEIVCDLRFIKGNNYTPTVSIASDLLLNNPAESRGETVSGTLAGYDPDGDRLTFEIVTYPQNGCVILSDRGEGLYTYTPNPKFTGEDRFCYIVTDLYGQSSAAVTVLLTVTEDGVAAKYAK